VNTVAAKVTPSPRVPSLHRPILWSLAVSALLLWGSHAHLDRFITPQRGLGYALGITGGSMMLVLLIYSARKRYAWLAWLGGIPAWFEIHMVFGIAGPVLVLFHSNFHLGSTNSNVALVCMLLVAGSGVIGRYFYTRLHAHMDGNEDTLEQLMAVGERLRAQTTSIAFLPGLLDAIERIEAALITPPRGLILRFLHLCCGGLRLVIARWRVRREIAAAKARAESRESALVAQHAARIAEVAQSYAYRRLEAGRRAAELRLYARLFSFWHVLHIPLFFMLLIAGVAHVIAVNIY
jgi:hypothetical protein